MVAEKGLPGPVADRIGEFVVLKGGPREVLQMLQAPGHPLNENSDGKVRPFFPGFSQRRLRSVPLLQVSIGLSITDLSQQCIILQTRACEKGRGKCHTEC